MTWQQVRLEDLGDWYGGGTPSKSRPDFWVDGVIPWLSPKDMGQETLHSTQDKVTASAVSASSVRLVPPNSVAVVVRSGILERTLPVAQVPFATTLNQDMKAVVPRPGIDSRWIAWGLRAFEPALLSATRKAGTTVASIEMPRFYAFELPVPPLDEQHRILDLLEDHVSRLDAAVASLTTNRVRLAALRQTSIDRAFWIARHSSAEKFYQGLVAGRRFPAGKQKPIKPVAAPDTEMLPNMLPWPVASLEQLTDPTRTIRYGILKPKANNGTVPYVEVKDLRDVPLEVGRLRLTSVDLDAQYAASRLRPGDVVVAVRGSFERSAVVPASLRGANVSRDVVRVAPLPDISPYFLHYWHQTSLSKRYLRRHARGVAVRGVNVSSLRAMPVPVLPPDAQNAVVRAITEQEEAITRLDISIQVAKARATRLRRSLLSASFSGQFDGGVRD